MAAKAKKKGGGFVKQAAILAAASLLVRFLGFIYRWPLTNMIGDEGNAIYAGGYYIYTFLLILSSAGLPAAISKLVSERIALKQYRNAHRVFQAALVISTCFGTFFAIVMGLGAHRLADMIDIADSYYSLLTLCPTLVIVAIMSVFRGYFQGMRTMVPTAISQIVEQVFNAFFSVSGMGVHEHQYSGRDDEEHSSGICRWYDGDGDWCFGRSGCGGLCLLSDSPVSALESRAMQAAL